MDTFKNAQWITCAKPGESNYAPIFRKEFEVSAVPESAVLYICGLGYHDVRIDSAAVTDEKLAPAFTHYSKRAYFSKYDVKTLLYSGSHVLSVELGRGFFAMNTPNVWLHHENDWHDEPKLICSLHIKYSDGGIETICSNESFTARSGATTRACLYTGETVDGRILDELSGWQLPGFSGKGFSSAAAAEPYNGQLLPAYGPAIRVVGEYRPVSIKRTADDRQLVTFPYNISGWCRVHAKGKSGETLKIRYGETADDMDHVNLNQTLVEGDLQTDEYIFGESGEMDFEPKFSYKGFKLVELIGDIEDLQLSDITAKWVVSDVKDKSSFSCSNALINDIYSATYRTIRNNLHSIPTDTPIYEKNGWTGDAGLIAHSAMRFSHLTEFFDKWLLDIGDSMLDNGMVPLIVPASKWGHMFSPEWVDCTFEILGELYKTTGDTDIIRRHYLTAKRLADYYLASLGENGLPENTVLGDWIPPGHSEGSCGAEGNGMTSACYIIKGIKALAGFAEIIGESEDNKLYGEKAAEITKALNDTYFDYENGKYKLPCEEYRQVPDILTLALDIAPQAHRKALATRLLSDIKDRGYHLNTGILGTKYLLPVLSDYEYHEAAYKLAVQDTYPSWGYWIVNGECTLLEAWELDARSHNHYMFGTVADWITGYLAGLRSENAADKSVIIAPMPTGDCTFCELKTEVPSGPLSISWKLESGEFVLDIEVPDSLNATVILPSGESIPTAASGRYICKA